MAKEYLTTFQVAELMSVSPDAVLKWIKSGKIKAYRTPGGHHRIERKCIESFLQKSKTTTPSKIGHPPKDFQYCWEYNFQQNNSIDQCKECVVYRTRARNCFEMCGFPAELGHLKRFCDSDCQTCEYYNMVKSSN